ncbi:hypothetical protein O181_006412 [Austropuccinia psidii MF-1]|uniref:Uncharacterized protein n=1 Tax=Austropuccinia psidii MF-1 TaxID=1389203 RepID=A0A9Q3BKR5_9BASI|nr:hypothetical protein [Austropuccinia psidii MF-1]
MSKEDQIILMSYSNLLPVLKIFSRCNTFEIPTSNPSQQPQQSFTLIWCSGSQHSRWGVLSQPCVITPPMGVYSKSSLIPFYGQLAMSSFLWPIGHVIIFMANWPCHHFYGQLAMSSFLWPIGPFWCFMAFGPYPLSRATYGLRPYPATIAPFYQFSTSPAPREIPLFWAWESIWSSRGCWPLYPSPGPLAQPL